MIWGNVETVAVVVEEEEKIKQEINITFKYYSFLILPVHVPLTLAHQNSAKITKD